MPVVPQGTEELIDMLCPHFYRVLLVMEKNEALYPVNIGFFCLVGVALIPHTPLEAVDKALRARWKRWANIVHVIHLNILYVCTV